MSQNQQILSHLRQGRTITAIQALKWFQCFRLAARIDNIKRILADGEKIVCVTINLPNGKRIGQYHIENETETNETKEGIPTPQ